MDVKKVTLIAAVLLLAGMLTMAKNACAVEDKPLPAAADSKAPAAAEASAPKPDASDKDAAEWRFQFGTYAWMSSISQKLTLGSEESSSDVGILDILPVLDFAACNHFEAQKGPWGLFSEFDFVKLSPTGEARARVGIPVKFGTSLDLKQITAELGGLRSFDWEKVGVDALAGARYSRFDTRVQARFLDKSDVKDWVDPFVGARLRFKLSEKWGLAVRGDVGGFGAGSDLTWLGTAFFSYQVRESMALIFGYKYMDVHFDNKDSAMDMKTYGPGFGVVFTI
jgi:hypothetical protein